MLRFWRKVEAEIEPLREGVVCLPPPATKNDGCVSQAGVGISAVSHSRHVCSVTQQTCLLCDTAASLCCVTQQTLFAGPHI